MVPRPELRERATYKLKSESRDDGGGSNVNDDVRDCLPLSTVVHK